jgi:hypothetical protein
MPGEWHNGIQNKIAEFGEKLGFLGAKETKIPAGNPDCIWWSPVPIPQVVVMFEFESRSSGPQIVKNLVKVLSIPSQSMPRFLVQIYKDKLDQEYLWKIARLLPVATRIIHNVGNDVNDAAERAIIELFNWIGEEVEKLSADLYERLKETVARERILKIFHYGEGRDGEDLRYLDRAIRSTIKRRLVWIDSSGENKKKFPSSLSGYDIVIISDVDSKHLEMDVLKRYIEKNVREEGKSFILTGGWGLNESYNVLDTFTGTRIIKHEGRTRMDNVAAKISGPVDTPGFGLPFGGFNLLERTDPNTEVISEWNIDGYPALTRRKFGHGNVLVFTSDCSPSWGKHAIMEDGFGEMWEKVLNAYCTRNE